MGRHVSLQLLWICVTIMLKKKEQEIAFFHHFGIHSWNDKKNICWPR